MKSAFSRAVLKLKENQTMKPKLLISLSRIHIIYELSDH